MLPPAPARLSMTKGWPRISAIFGVTVRATMSVPPPGGNGTMTRIGLDGKVCASALLASATAKRHCFSTATSFSGRGSFVGLASMLEDLLRRARMGVAAAGNPNAELLQVGHGLGHLHQGGEAVDDRHFVDTRHAGACDRLAKVQ